MAASSFIDSGQITPVFYPFGKFSGDQRPRFVRAPFVILSLSGKDYVMPIAGGSTSADLNNIIGTDVFDNEQYLGRQDFGFEGSDELVTGEHEWGTGQDSMKGVHRFGFI